jgi:hypothetical protein
MDQIPWLLLLYSLPTHRNSERVSVWRRFKKIGALQVTTSTYLVPDQASHYEQFQWLAKQIRDVGGEATLVRVREIEGLPNEKLVERFNKVRDKEYAVLTKALRALAGHGKMKVREDFADQVERARRRFREVREVDFFNSPQAEEVSLLLAKLERTVPAKGTLARVDPNIYRRRTWLTRPRPEIDRVGSAWLIRKFIDPDAKFIFARTVAAAREAVSFDMVEAEFSHHGEDCTFETLMKRFAIRDRAVRKIAEMIHDADLDDAKFQRNECIGIDRILKGWAKEGLADEELLEQGFRCFDGLYAFLQRT